MNQAIIGSGNGLTFVQLEVITWTNADLLSYVPQEQTSMKLNQNTEIHIQEYVFVIHLRMLCTIINPILLT